MKVAILNKSKKSSHEDSRGVPKKHPPTGLMHTLSQQVEGPVC